MKLVILAGGLGTRLSEETKVKPKPLIKIGNRPIIWHIMKIYSKFGINEFIICQGYKGDLIKKELSKYENKENWNIKYINTGLNTMTGGRIKNQWCYKFRNNRFRFNSRSDKGFCIWKADMSGIACCDSLLISSCIY